METTANSSNSLAPGTYRLIRDVASPHPDRRVNQNRVTSYEGWVKWPAGLVFVADANPEFPDRIRLKARGGYHSYSFDFPGCAFSLLAAALAPIEETTSDFLLRTRSGIVQWSALQLLDRLNIPLSEVGRLLADMDAESEQDE